MGGLIFLNRNVLGSLYLAWTTMGRFGPPKASTGHIRGAMRSSPWAADCKVVAASAVGYRESLLTQLAALVHNWPTDARKPKTEAVRLLTNVSKDLREAGLRCVEKIVAWVLAASDATIGPEPFIWNDQNYLLKAPSMHPSYCY